MRRQSYGRKILKDKSDAHFQPDIAIHYHGFVKGLADINVYAGRVFRGGERTRYNRNQANYSCSHER
jgi:hypothetical protein